ncbi:hypothetical protein ACKWTF_001025 [Chironomus riparius]
MDRGKLYNELYSLWNKAYPQNQKQNIQKECISFWNSIKEKDNFKDHYTAKINDLKKIIGNRRSIISFFKQTSSSTTNEKASTSTACTSTVSTFEGQHSASSSLSSESLAQEKDQSVIGNLSSNS